MDFNEIITFEGGINTDDTPQGVPKGDYRDFSYCRLGYNSGNAFAVETSAGTIEINNNDIEPEDKVLGAAQWLKENAIVYFLYKDTGVHEIWVYYITTQTHQVVVQDAVLNFSPDWPVFHANVIDDILKWTDGRWDPDMYETDGTRLFNPPYQINLRKALDNFYTIIDLQTIDAVKWPMEPPIVSYFTDITRNDNKLRGKLYRFIIQPIYENGETGVWSMYSTLQLPEVSEFVSGTNWVYPNNSNVIRIQFDTGPKIIRKFNLAVQQYDRESLGADPPFGVFLQLDKDQDTINNNEFYTVNFYGGVATSPAIDVFKNYDRLPITSDCQEYLPTNQITYTNFREGYDKPSELYEKLDVTVGYDLNEIDWKPKIGTDITFVANGLYRYPNPDYNPPIDPEPFLITYFGILEFKNYKTLPALSSNFFFTVSQTISLALPVYGNFVYTVTDTDIANALLQPTIYDQNVYMIQLIGDSFSAFAGLPNGVFGLINTFLPSPGYYYYWNSGTWQFGIGGSSTPIPGFGSVSPTSYRSTISVSSDSRVSLKVGATHEFGIVYGDRAYRDSTVYTVDSMDLFVPWFYDIDRSGFNNPQNPFTVIPNFEIRHIPPIWATKYWIVAKPATEILSFQQITSNNYNISGYPTYVQSIYVDPANANRYKIVLDNYYVTKNEGASIRNEIKVGDKVRFIRRRADGFFENASSFPYLPYLELDVLGYIPSDSTNGGRQVILTNLFDSSLIDVLDLSAVNNLLFGSLIEIYTPRPYIDDTGNVFVSSFKDVTEAIQIKNPHTEDRSHGSPVQYYVQYGFFSATDVFYISGDQSQLNGTTGWPITIHYADGSIDQDTTNVTSAIYNSLDNITVLQLSAIAADPTISYITFNGQDQVVSGLTSTTPASYRIDYGDVYVRRRNYATGLTNIDSIAYYYVEDPNYSDYWSSDIHNTGRFRIEDQNAKMIDRKASSIHSETFILGTQINGLSSFALDNQNIENMNPLYGEIVRTYMSGREGKTLKCLQPKRENSIYIQFYPNEVGSDSSVRVSNKTFASWFDYKSLFGCSDAGATALLPNGSVMYFDNNSGVFIYSGGNGQIVVSEIDPDTGKDYKFRTKTKELAKAYNESANPLVRTYINETVGEVGFAFSFDNEETYEHVVFDYVNMRWRSTYDYNFRQFCNLGQTLVGWGKNNQLYLHNQDGVWTFHGDSFIQKVTFVSNEGPLFLKRYQDIALISDDKFSIEASSEPNRSYPLGMKTMMTENLIGMFEGYGKTNYRKNLYDPKFFVPGNISTTNLTTWTLNGNQTSLNGEMITIIQDVDKNIYTGIIDNPVYNSGPNTTDIEIVGLEPGTTGVTGKWYLSEKVLLNGEDVRANALTHTLSYDPAPGGVAGDGSILFSVAIKGVLS